MLLFSRTTGGGVESKGDSWMAYPVGVSVGYFVSDLLVMLQYQEVYDFQAILHHILIGNKKRIQKNSETKLEFDWINKSVGSAFMLGLYGKLGHPYHFFYLLEEISTPFLNLKWFLAHGEKREDTSQHLTISLLFAFTFFMGRIVFGGYIYVIILRTVKHCVTHYSYSPFLIFQTFVQLSLCTASRILNTYWFYLIMKKLRVTFFGSRKAKRI